MLMRKLEPGITESRNRGRRCGDNSQPQKRPIVVLELRLLKLFRLFRVFRGSPYPTDH